MAVMFNSSLMSLNVECSTAEEAIQEAGKRLLNNKLCLPKYIDEMINVFHQFGAYIVLDSGIAMPHARPEKGALGTGFSVVRLKQPVSFGHEDFDPVQLIATLIENDIVTVAQNALTVDPLFDFIQQFTAKNN